MNRYPSGMYFASTRGQSITFLRWWNIFSYYSWWY
jgi:hypothetical protein